MRKRTLEGAFPSRYLTSADVEGRRLTATIANVDYEKMSDEQEKAVVHFERFERTATQKKAAVKDILNDDLPDDMKSNGDADESDDDDEEDSGPF